MKSKDHCFSLGILGTAFHTFVPRTENVMTVLPFFIDTFLQFVNVFCLSDEGYRYENVSTFAFESESPV